jgi:hypothetical protein
MARAVQSRRIPATCDEGSVENIGTEMAPRPWHAMSVMAQSLWFSARIATRSPRSMPRLANPQAKFWTRDATS